MRQTRGWAAYHKRLEARSEAIQGKPKRRKWWFEILVISVANLGVWLAGSGIISAMLDNKNAFDAIFVGVSVMISTVFIAALVERRLK